MHKFYQMGVIPIIVIDNLNQALPLAKALVDGGISCVEITFRTQYAKQAIKLMKSHYPQLYIGAGTILTIEQVDEAIEAGAEFLVSPSLNPKVILHAQKQGVEFFPGCSCARDIELALECGITNVKFFPSEASGGIQMIEALAAPYHHIYFIPTGGIDITNIEAYLKCEKVLACGGSFMVPQSLLNESRFTEITRLCQQAIQQAFGIEVLHVGLFNSNKDDSMHQLLVSQTNLVSFTQNTSYITLGVNDVARVKCYYEQLGFEFDETSKQYENNQLTQVQFKDKISQSIFYLVQKPVNQS